MESLNLEPVLADFIFGFGTLFAIINPYGLAFVFLSRTGGLAQSERTQIARRIALYSFIVLVVSLFAGSTILRVFGISLPALRIAGGLVVAVTGWLMLNEAHDASAPGPTSSGGIEAIARLAFFPLTMPLTTGPGTIATAITLGANRPEELQGLVLSSLTSLLVAAAVALTILNAYRHAGTLARLFGPEGTRVVTRLSAFLLLCVGVEIILTGVLDVVRPLLPARP